MKSYNVDLSQHGDEVTLKIRLGFMGKDKSYNHTTEICYEDPKKTTIQSMLNDIERLHNLKGLVIQ